jgi:hypothetical protein
MYISPPPPTFFIFGKRCCNFNENVEELSEGQLMKYEI